MIYICRSVKTFSEKDTVRYDNRWRTLRYIGQKLSVAGVFQEHFDADAHNFLQLADNNPTILPEYTDNISIQRPNVVTTNLTVVLFVF